MSYSDLPDSVKKAIEDLLDSLSGLTKEQIIALLGAMLGEEGIKELQDIIDLNQEFSIEINDEDFNMEDFVEELEEFSEFGEFYAAEDDIEPYYEISHKDNQEGEIIVEMPGLESKNAMIDWYEYENELYIHSVDSIERYKLIIPIPEYYRIIEDEIDYRGGLLIIPFIIT